MDAGRLTAGEASPVEAGRKAGLRSPAFAHAN
jgi:hypothetical protein